MDPTLQSILAVVEAVKADSAVGGSINVPRTLAALRHEAAARGLPADAAGVFAVAQSISAEATAQERARHDRGLGGALRHAVQALPALRGRRSIIEEAEMRPYVDPAQQTGVADSLLARKVQRAVDAMAERIREMQPR